MNKITAAITGVQGYVPEHILSNEDLTKIVDTSDEWITTRTGIKERRIMKNGASSDMAAEAVKSLLKKKNIDPLEIELVVLASVTPDHLFPSTANILCDKVGMTNAWGFDLLAACSGFLFALTTASQFIENGRYKKVLVVGVDKMSSIVDYTDRTTCIIFGDGAGVVLLEPNEEGLGIQDHILRTDGSGREFLIQQGGGSVNPATIDSVEKKMHFVKQEGLQVFKFAVTKMADVSVEIMERNNLSSEDVAWLVPHQANLRIIDATANRMGVSNDKVMINIQKYGNTTAGTLPLCLWDYEKQLKKGDNIILSAFGGGFTWGSIYLKWAYNS
ncbi:MAG: ketoacyl-ACP synthase III [Flavobacteriales bacterium]|nr:ketoacyl-ACP synthase III [Crocinitomicaceae bacterium]NBW30139.1 ketoacyl-ACP synthase III [Flavobacteriales bacterium]NDA98477.1 ketoacyl-ACP synthase III [Flavobacteriia bacterium]NDC28478.1 ketoacyl-ACP synthase III [Crocinitomicaceae bacterium]NDC92198.1 ketoacyl-ACP synthase III [Flavobacteriales bacterium]